MSALGHERKRLATRPVFPQQQTSLRAALGHGARAQLELWRSFPSGLSRTTRTWEKLIAVKSLDQAFEIQTNYAKNACENWMAEMSKIGEMYSSTARDAYKPVEKTMEKHKA